MVTCGDGHGLILNGFLEICLILLVVISGMYSGLTGIGSNLLADLMIIGILTMALGHKRVNSVGATDKYNQFLKPKWKLS